jgi:tetratricopeptide (TPR) repeat protein
VYRTLGGDESGIGHLHLQRVLLAAAEGDIARTRTLYVDALARARASGDEALLNAALSMGLLAIGWGDYQGARQALQEWLTVARARHDLVSIAGSTLRLGIVARLQGDFERAHDLLRAGLAASRAAGSTIHLAAARAALGDVARQQGDLAHARAEYDALLAAAGERYDDDAGSMVMISESHGRRVILCHYAVLAIQEGAHARGVRLLGAALPAAQAFLRVSCPDVQLDCEAALATARTTLGEAAAVAWAEGQAMSLEQVVAYALEDAPAKA